MDSCTGSFTSQSKLYADISVRARFFHIFFLDSYMHVDFKQETAWYTHFATQEYAPTSHYYISDMLCRSLVTFDVRNTIDYKKKRYKEHNYG